MEFDEIGELQSKYSELSAIIKEIKLEIRNFDKNEESTELNEKRIKLLELYDELEDVQLKLKEHREKQIEFKRAEKTENAEQMERESNNLKNVMYNVDVYNTETDNTSCVLERSSTFKERELDQRYCQATNIQNRR